MMQVSLSQIQEAVSFIQSKTNTKPEVGIILGTGLGALVGPPLERVRRQRHAVVALEDVREDFRPRGGQRPAGAPHELEVLLGLAEELAQ